MDLFDIGVAPERYTVASADEIRAASSGPVEAEEPVAGTHIELASPCVHPWMLTIVRALLGHPLRELEDVVDGTRWVVIEPAEAHRVGDTMEERAADDARKTLAGFAAMTHAAALAALLERADPAKRRAFIAKRCAEEPEDKRAAFEAIIERLDAVIACELRSRDLVLDALPIPALVQPPYSPETRRKPYYLYRSLISINHRLARLIELGAPAEVVLTTRVRLQEQVDDVLTAGIGKLMHEVAPSRGLAYTKLDASVTAGGEVVQAETRAMRLAGARAIVAAASPRDEAVMRALCAKLRSCAAATR